MAQTISLSENKFNKLIATVSELKNEVAKLAQKLEAKEEPPYGSNEWWEKSDEKALKSIKQGKGITLHNSKEIDDFFKSL